MHKADTVAHSQQMDAATYALPHFIGLPLNEGQDFGFTPNKRPDYRKPILTWAY
jgi:hypothetical protein